MTMIKDFPLPDPAVWLRNLPGTAAPEVTTAYPDPMGELRQLDPKATIHWLQEAMGLLPGIFINAVNNVLTTNAPVEYDCNLGAGTKPADEVCDLHNSVADQLTREMSTVYGFGWPEMPAASAVNEHGVYTYPEDPDLKPWVSIKHPSGAQMLVYQYGIIAVRWGASDWRLARLD